MALLSVHLFGKDLALKRNLLYVNIDDVLFQCRGGIGHMEPNNINNKTKIFSAFSNLDKYTKRALNIGIILFLALFALGTVLVVLNHTGDYSTFNEFVATSVIKTSFTVLAEVIIGVLLVDFVFNGRK